MNFFPQPCKFPRVSGHPFHHGMTNQNGQGQVLGGQSPSQSARLGAKQGHAKSATFAKDFSDQQNSPSRPWRPLREPSAFSLTEVVIAMGVAAVAFTSIIALFPLGLNMSKESYEATQAAVIAQSIMADLSDQASAGSGKLIQKTGTNAMSAANYETIQLMAASGGTDRYIYLAYDQQIRTDSSNSPVMLRPCTNSVSLNGPNEPPWFKTNAPAGAIFLVKVSLKHSFRMSAAGTSNPQRVDVTIESPANAPATNRVQYVFSGVIPQN